MGDCRIRLSVAKTLLEGGEKSSPHETVSITRVLSADSTIRELVESTPELWGLYRPTSTVSNHALTFQLWDCTYHPPRDITDWPINTYSELTGPKSQTLHKAGCFPSGTWMVLPRGMTPNQFSSIDYNDAQYNQKDHARIISTGTVDFKDAALVSSSQSASQPLPSQVLESITHRFSDEEVGQEAQVQHAKAARRKNQEVQRKRQQERAGRLDQRIQNLEAKASDKNKKVSDQVRQMLVKSRATGNKNLKQQDRLYFQCLLDTGSDDDLLRDFRFFSPQDSFAKIANSFVGPKGATNVEVLIKRIISVDGSSIMEYRRFPVTMRVYEAIANKYVDGDQVDTVIVRWFSNAEDATTSVVDASEAALDVEMIHASKASVEPAEDSRNSQVMEHSSHQSMPEIFLDETLTAAIHLMDVANNKGKKPKKASAAANKVRNMQIKSKAKGDTKRIPKVEDRFFMEVVFVDGSGAASSTFKFLARTDPIERMLHSMDLQPPCAADWCFLVPRSDDAFFQISDPSIQLADAEAADVVKLFDRIILLPK